MLVLVLKYNERMFFDCGNGTNFSITAMQKACGGFSIAIDAPEHVQVSRKKKRTPKQRRGGR